MHIIKLMSNFFKILTCIIKTLIWEILKTSKTILSLNPIFYNGYVDFEWKLENCSLLLNSACLIAIPCRFQSFLNC